MFITKGKSDTFWRFAKPYGFKKFTNGTRREVMTTQGSDCNGRMRFIIQIMNYEGSVPGYATYEFFSKQEANEYFKKNFADYRLAYNKKGMVA